MFSSAKTQGVLVQHHHSQVTHITNGKITGSGDLPWPASCSPTSCYVFPECTAAGVLRTSHRPQHKRPFRLSEARFLIS